MQSKSHQSGWLEEAGITNTNERWQYKITDTDVLKRAEIQSVLTFLKLAQLRWTGHITRMPDERLPKKVFCGEL